MGVRETLNEKPAIAVGGTIGIIVLGLIFVIVELSGGGAPRFPTKSYYSVDDGASYFSDDIKLVPPFDHDGKQAVRAYLYKCEGGKEFVGFLERYKNGVRELKAPLTGDKGWLKGPIADKLTLIPCPDGASGLAQPVMP